MKCIITMRRILVLALCLVAGACGSSSTSRKEVPDSALTDAEFLKKLNANQGSSSAGNNISPPPTTEGRTPQSQIAVPDVPLANSVTGTVAPIQLTFDAGLVMRSGDVKQVAREEFRLLSRSLIDILRDAQFDVAKYHLSGFGLSYKMGLGKANDPETVAGDLVRKYTITSTVTDFSGKGHLTAPVGMYYIFAISTLGDNIVIWNFKIDLKIDQSITLDQNNAAEAL
jgi:hypothetical protein